MNVKKTILICATAMTISGTLNAMGPGGGRGGPPAEALDACVDKSESTACSFTSPGGDTIEGSCLPPPRGNGDLACVPEGGHRPPPRDYR